jgi:putative transposase
MRTNHPSRLKGFDYTGFFRYFLTFCTFERRRYFVHREHAEAVLSQFLRAAEREHMALLAYCFMPDHAHLLVEGQDEAAEGRRFIVLAKQLSGFHFKQVFGNPLWQRYSYEHTLRGEEPTLSVIRYIVENPVRAGLVTTPADYAFTGSGAYTIEEILSALQWQRRGAKSG